MARTTTGRYDVEAIKRDHPMADVVVSYGIELQSSGRALVGRCPFHEDGGRPNLYVYRRRRAGTASAARSAAT